MGDERRRLIRAVTAVVALLGLAACASAPGTIDPSGVDGLVVPTPSPDAADFVGVIDNPWLPLAPGSTWTRVAQDGDAELTEEVAVLPRTREVAGVDATQVRTTLRDEKGRTLSAGTAWFAQDREGNVWALGEQGVWQAGEDGAEAGLAMAREPRRGDGHRLASVPGQDDTVLRVGERGASVTVPAGRFTELLQVVRTTTGGADETELHLAEGVGVVVRQEPGGLRYELVRHSPGD